MSLVKDALVDGAGIDLTALEVECLLETKHPLVGVEDQLLALERVVGVIDGVDPAPLVLPVRVGHLHQIRKQRSQWPVRGLK